MGWVMWISLILIWSALGVLSWAAEIQRSGICTAFDFIIMLPVSAGLGPIAYIIGNDDLVIWRKK